MPKAPNYATFFSTYLRQDVPKDHLGEYRMDCPFHECPNPSDHFFANCDTGLWSCKRCETHGNARTLLTLLHEQFLAVTTQAQYNLLGKLRHLSADILEAAGFAYDISNDRWLVPYYTYDPQEGDFTDYLNNLGYFFPSSTNPKSQFVIHKAPVLPLYLYNPGMHSYPCSTSRSIICEGEWDTLAYYDVHRDTEDLVLGKPGSGFPLTFMNTLLECERIDLLLDNDQSGRKQTAAAIGTIQKSKQKKSIYVLDWLLVPNHDSVKDLRDYKIKYPSEFIDDISGGIIPYTSTGTTAGPNDETNDEVLTAGYVRDTSQFEEIPSFQEYIDGMRELLYITPETELAMAGVFAITTSISVPGEPLWGFVRGPASSGKTTFIESFGGTNQHYDNLSKVTAEAFVSGWKDDTGEDASYLPSLTYPIPKTLFIKDFTTVLTSPVEVQEKMFGLLTDIYDGHVKIPYGNNQVREYHNTYFNMVAGVTDILDAYSSASIGERFLRLDWLGQNYDSREYGRRALLNFGNTASNKDALTRQTLGFSNYLRTHTVDLHIEDQFVEPILDLAEFIAIIRTKVEADRFEGIKYRPRPELIPRLSKQLAKVYVSARVVLNSAERAFTIVRKFALDTCYGFPLDIVRYILEHPGASREDIAHGADIHAQRAYRVLKNLETTGVIRQAEKASTRKAGRPRQYFELNPKLLPALLPEKYINEPEPKSRPARERRREANPRNALQPKRPSPPKKRR